MNIIKGFSPPYLKISLLQKKINVDLNKENIDDFKNNSIELKKIFSLIKEKKAEILSPLKEEIKKKEKIFKPIQTEIETALNKARHKLLDFQLEQEKLLKEEKQKEIEKLNSSKDHNDLITKAKALTQTLPPKEKKVISYREKISIESIDKTKLSKKYLMPDERKILNDIMQGIAIQGIKIKREKVPVLR